MGRGLKILTAILTLIAALLVINTIVLDNQTKDAGVTIDGGRILSLPGGDVQVTDSGRPLSDDRDVPGRAPIVLIHCYSCSLHWWDRLTLQLIPEYRVIRIDLLGHGGSQKPKSGYSMEEQAGLVAGALDRLDVQGAVVVGHSMGFDVAVALAARASQLVDRLVNIDEGPSGDDCSLPFLAKVGYWPVVGEALRRLSPDFAVEDAYSNAFAPGYDPADGFPNPDQVIDDYNAMTYTSFKDSAKLSGDYEDEATLDTRLRQVPVPLLSIFGAEDRICEPESSQEAYAALPGAKTELIEGAGHSPNVEKPEETAALIEDFAAGATVATPTATPKPKPRRPDKPHREGNKAK